MDSLFAKIVIPVVVNVLSRLVNKWLDRKDKNNNKE
ncbi:MAG: type I addiction module toxin, Fst family [Desemzia incerta]